MEKYFRGNKEGLPMLNWTLDIRDIQLIRAIAKRAIPVALAMGIDADLAEIDTCLDLCHSNGCPLDLEGLLDTEDSSAFTQDVFGILAHIDKETGLLRDGFVPRYKSD